MESMADESRMELHYSEINQMGYDALLKWVYTILHKEEVPTGSSHEEFCFEYLEKTYRRLDPKVRECFEDALLVHLGDLANNINSTWLNDSGDDLLLLIVKIFRGSSKKEAAISLLKKMSTKKELKSLSCDCNLHYRSLQALIGIEYKGEPSFWIDQYDQHGESYASLTLSGLFLRGTREAFSWAIGHSKRPVVQQAILSKLPRVLSKYGSNDIRPQLISYSESLPYQAQSELEAVLSYLGITLPADPRSIFFADWDLSDLILLCECIDVTCLTQDFSAVLTSIEEKITHHVDSDLKNEGYTGELLLRSVCVRLKENPKMFVELRGKIETSLSKILNDDNLLFSEQTIQMLQEAHCIVKYDAKKLTFHEVNL